MLGNQLGASHDRIMHKKWRFSVREVVDVHQNGTFLCMRWCFFFFSAIGFLLRDEESGCEMFGKDGG